MLRVSCCRVELILVSFGVVWLVIVFWEVGGSYVRFWGDFEVLLDLVVFGSDKGRIVFYWEREFC